MRKIMFGIILCVTMIISSCGHNDCKQYFISYYTEGGGKPIYVLFYGKENSYIIHFESENRQHRLVVDDTFTGKTYYFDSDKPIYLEKTNIPMRQSY